MIEKTLSVVEIVLKLAYETFSPALVPKHYVNIRSPGDKEASFSFST